jgi:hypothetical protein
MQSDFELLPDGKLKPRTNGGAREGAGRKPSGYVKPQETLDFELARARKESALADKYELEYKIASGEYVSRASVKQASATVLSTIAQTLRSVSDNLERRGVPTDVCVLVDSTITEVLADAAKDLALLSEGDA